MYELIQFFVAMARHSGKGVLLERKKSGRKSEVIHFIVATARDSRKEVLFERK